ncbi:THAP domain-containing protein 2-like [Copidosoma floridanum]|uniref:THAP domain-containing protein 2-like n=1 Tax=Copidosoma floridanum TaxID=29053 RepID=UPI0006C9E0FD|nr:THAP domain-containing protein 2-like [Copidosoma floridanum]
MPKKCIVCKIKQSGKCGRSFHKFPEDDSKRKQWYEALNITTTLNYNTAFVCSEHFDASNYLIFNDERQRKKLSPDAIPFDQCAS